MKKFFALMPALLLAVACAAPPTNREAAPVNANRAAEPAVVPLTEADAIAKERAVWDALKKKDYDSFASMLATNYLEVGSDAVYDKAGIVTYLKDLDFTDASFADWKLLPLGKDAALLMYNLTLQGKYKGKDIPPGPYRVSSAWVNNAGKWQAAFYQETLGTTGTTPPAPPASPTPTGSPAAKGADIASITDPIARERAIYDALKRKDYDAFGAALDEAQVEVWPEGFSNKAATLTGVRGFDATKAELSELRTMKIGSEAEMVTYTVSMAGPKPERVRATTIWIKRGDKWLAIFHQGTAVSEPDAAPSPAKV